MNGRERSDEEWTRDQIAKRCRETIAQEVGDLRGSRRGDIFTSYEDAYDTAIADAAARIRAGGGIGPGGLLGAFIAEHFPTERGDECLSTEAVAIRLLSGIVNAVRDERDRCIGLVSKYTLTATARAALVDAIRSGFHP